MKNIAVLAGLGEVYKEYENRWPRLSFTINNVVSVGSRLNKDKWDIAILLEENATRQAILDSLTVAGNNTHELVFFYYSGHTSFSAQTPTVDRHEFMITYDYYVANSNTSFLYDNEITQCLDDILSKGRKVCCIFETCYAEGLIDLADIASAYQENIAIISSSAKSKKTNFSESQNSFFFLSLEESLRKNAGIKIGDLPQKINESLQPYRNQYPELDIVPTFHIGANIKNSSLFI